MECEWPLQITGFERHQETHFVEHISGHSLFSTQQGTFNRCELYFKATTIPEFSDVSFNLPLTAEQKSSRAEVPLPYFHKGISAHLGASIRALKVLKGSQPSYHKVAFCTILTLRMISMTTIRTMTSISSK
jgi:hypothetical protein